MKSDSGLGENEFKSRIKYCLHWSDRGVSVTSLIPVMCSGHPNALEHPPVSCLTLLPSTSIQKHLCTESFPLPPLLIP